MKRIQILLTTLFISILTFSQDCDVYIPNEVGSELEQTHYDKKGKVSGISKQTVKEIKEVEGGIEFSVHQLHTDEKGKNPIEADLEFECKGGVFYVDMDAYVNQEQMKAYEDMDMKVTTTEMGFPKNPQIGQTLKDGNVTIKINGPIPMTMTVDIVNRKIEAIEDITTPAGTFSCVKIVEDVKTKMGFSYEIHSVAWYSLGVGTVKSESYRKGKLSTSTLLTAVKK